MFQNRVNPFGAIIATPERGAWIGNRGVLHNDHQQIIRSYKIRQWITCVLQFRGRHRNIMQPNRWTELFFLDEATAYAAGHRPCFQCRYTDHQLFKSAWLKGNPEYDFDMKTPIAKIDDIIHHERITKDGAKVTYEENIQLLPDATFVSYNGKAYLIWNHQMYLWTPAGYEKPIAFPKQIIVQVLTPKSIVNMYSSGFKPEVSI